MTVAIIVPFNDQGCPHRRRAHDWIIDRYQRLHPGLPIIEGWCGEPWSKGAAVADAVGRSDAEVLVLADADSYVQPEVITEAVSKCLGGVPWLVPHRHVFRLTEEETERVYRGRDADIRQVVRQPYTGPAGGGITVLTRQAYETVGGIDQRYIGWGGEDISFGLALCNLVGWYERLTGHLIHLWHPHPAPDLRGSPESERLVAAYREHKRNPAGIRALLRERDLESSSPPPDDRDGHASGADGASRFVR